MDANDKKNETIDLQADTLTDLAVTGEQADETKGGPDHSRQIQTIDWSWGVTNSGNY
jgi:hypothetical protein